MHIFTDDVDVARDAAAVIPATALMLLAHPVSVMLEGMLLSRRDLGFIGLSYASFAVVSQLAFKALLQRERDDTKPLVTLAAVWAISAIFQLSRAAIFAFRTGVLDVPNLFNTKKAEANEAPAPNYKAD